MSYQWDFGDNSALKNGDTVSHQYQQDGDYLLLLNSGTGGALQAQVKLLTLELA